MHKKRRGLDVDFETIEEKQSRRKGKRHQHKRKNMTYVAFATYKKKPEHGGFAEAQCQELWQDITAAREVFDTKGVVNGMGGFKRYKVSVSSSSGSFSEDGREWNHILSAQSKRGGRIDGADVDDFMAGTAELMAGAEEDEAGDDILAELERSQAEPSCESTHAYIRGSLHGGNFAIPYMCLVEGEQANSKHVQSGFVGSQLRM